MAPKPKRLRTPKKGLKKNNKRKAQSPPDTVSSDGFVPTHKDVLDAIGLLATRGTADESRIARGPPPTVDTVQVGRSRTQASKSADAPPEAGPYLPEALPPVETEGLPQVEDQMRASIVDRLRGAPTNLLASHR